MDKRQAVREIEVNNFLKNNIILEDMDQIYASRENWKELKNKKIYVTGAAGMIASYCVMFFIYLNEIHDFHIHIYAGCRSIEKTKKRFGIYLEKDYFHVLQKDVIAPLDIDVKLDYILHAASFASPQFYGKMPVETMLPNVIGMYHLLEYAKEQKVDGFLFFSSGSVYGSIHNVESITESNTGTMDFLALGNMYGESKRCGEALGVSYFREYDVPVKSARIQHTYGPTLDIYGDKRVFSEFVNNIVNNQNIVLKSDGKAKRSFCYISDTVSALMRILLDGENGETYNIGNDQGYLSIGELADLLVNLFPEKKLQVIYEKREDAGYSSSPEQRTIPVSVDKLKALGWNAKCSVQQGFYRTIQYFA